MGPGSEVEKPLEEALRGAREERDRALEQLAMARSELEAIRMAHTTQGEALPGAFVPEGRQALPLRYRLADVLNEAVKGRFDRVHQRARNLFERVTRPSKRA